MYGKKNIGRESPRHFTGGIPLPDEVLPPWTEGSGRNDGSEPSRFVCSDQATSSIMY